MATVTLSAIMYSMVKIQKFIQDLRERMASMQPEINFQGIYAQVKHKHTMFSRLQNFVFVYFVLLFIDYAAVQQIWQQQREAQLQHQKEQGEKNKATDAKLRGPKNRSRKRGHAHGSSASTHTRGQKRGGGQCRAAGNAGP